MQTPPRKTSRWDSNHYLFDYCPLFLASRVTSANVSITMISLVSKQRLQDYIMYSFVSFRGSNLIQFQFFSEHSQATFIMLYACKLHTGDTLILDKHLWNYCFNTQYVQMCCTWQECFPLNVTKCKTHFVSVILNKIHERHNIKMAHVLVFLLQKNLNRLLQTYLRAVGAQMQS